MTEQTLERGAAVVMIGVILALVGTLFFLVARQSLDDRRCWNAGYLSSTREHGEVLCAHPRPDLRANGWVPLESVAPELR